MAISMLHLPRRSKAESKFRHLPKTNSMGHSHHQLIQVIAEAGSKVCLPAEPWVETLNLFSIFRSLIFSSLVKMLPGCSVFNSVLLLSQTGFLSTSLFLPEALLCSNLLILSFEVFLSKMFL